MPETSHTPGPWFVSDRPHSYGCEVAAGKVDGQVIARSNGAPWPTLAEQQANARLIAAAPDMLDACRGAEFLQAYIGPSVWDGHAAAAFRALAAAIAKATAAN